MAVLFKRSLFTLMVFALVFVTAACTEEEHTAGKPDEEKEVQASTDDEEASAAAATFVSYDEWYDADLHPNTEEMAEKKIPVKVKGIYLTGWSAGGAKFQTLLDLVDDTELNAMVIDTKEDKGLITYDSKIPLVNEIEADSSQMIRDIDAKLKTLKEHNVYTIARVVTFKDPYLAAKKPEWAMQKKTGGVWYDPKGVSWVDPYRKEVWDYAISVAKEAAQKGFDEIQFDYVRFPANGKLVDREVKFHNPNGWSKAKNIAKFLEYAKKELEPYHVYVSADVFGLVPSVTDDMGIGQQWELISPVVDYISPMMYPSHYAQNTYGLSVPDAQPYETIYQGLLDARKKDEKIRAEGKTPAIIRPWYQDFTATWVSGHVSYGAEEVLAQIRAGKELGVEEYMIWDPKNTYSEGAWRR